MALNDWTGAVAPAANNQVSYTKGQLVRAIQDKEYEGIDPTRGPWIYTRYGAKNTAATPSMINQSGLDAATKDYKGTLSPQVSSLVARMNASNKLKRQGQIAPGGAVRGVGPADAKTLDELTRTVMAAKVGLRALPNRLAPADFNNLAGRWFGHPDPAKRRAYEADVYRRAERLFGPDPDAKLPAQIPLQKAKERAQQPQVKPRLQTAVDVPAAAGKLAAWLGTTNQPRG